MKKTKTAIEYDYIVHSIGTKEDPAYEAIVPTLNAIIYGDSAAELESGILQVIEAQRRRQKVMPKPDAAKKRSGKFVMRMNPHLHDRLALEAKVRGTSLNAYLQEKIAV